MDIVTLEAMRLVGIRVRCAGDRYEAEIPLAAASLRQRMGEIGGRRRPERWIGAYKVGDYSEDEDGYWVCVETDDRSPLPEGMVALHIPSQKYAAIRHTGPVSAIKHTYLTLHNRILAHRLERIHHAWHLEIYDWGEDEDGKNGTAMLYDTIK